MRGTVSWLLVGLMVFSGCSDNVGESSKESTSSASASHTTEPETENEPVAPEPSVTGPLGSGEFCELVGDIAGGDEKKSAAATWALLQRGLPEELDGDAHSGLQVLLDHATEFGSLGDSWRAYRALEKGERAQVRALTWWVTKTCGKGYLEGLIPDLPELPDLPDWLTDRKLPGRG